MSDQEQKALPALTDAEAAHMKYIRKNGLPTLRRASELKEQLGRKVLAAQAAGAEDRDALDAFSIVNEWLMIRSDQRLMQAFMKIAADDVVMASRQQRSQSN